MKLDAMTKPRFGRARPTSPEEVHENVMIECEEKLGGDVQGRPYEEWAAWWAGLTA
jgi:hypothetical protein